MKRKVISIVLSFMMVFALLPNMVFAADSENEDTDSVQQEEIDYDSEELFELESLDDAFYEDTSDVSEDEVSEIEDMDTESMGEDMELGLPDDEDFEEPEGEDTEAVDNIDETEDLNLEEPEDDEDNEEGYEESEELGEEEIIGGEEGGDEELGAASASLIVPSKATVGVGKTTSITPGYKGTGAKYYTMKIQDKDRCSAQWAKKNGKCVLNVTGKKSGSTYITIKLKGGALGLFTLDKRYIRVDVPKLTVSPTSITVHKGSAKKFTFSYANCTESVKLKWSAVNSKNFSASWGKWTKKSIPLTITGKTVGNSYLKVSLVNSKTNEVYATRNVTAIIAAQPSVKLSSSKVNVTAEKQSIIKVSYSNLNERAYYSVGSNNSKAYSVKWGSTSGQTRELIITGKSKGSGKVTVYLKSSNTGKVLASATATVNVSANPKITASTSSVKVKTGQQAQIKVTASGVSGKYAFSCSPGKTTVLSVSWGSWYNNSNTLKINGLNAGNQKLTLYLKNSKGTVLASTTINVTVEKTGTPTVKLSNSSVGINEGRTTQVIGTVTNMPDGAKIAQVSWTDSTVCKCTIDWSGKNPIITVTGKKSGTTNFTVTIKRKADNAVLAKATGKITVRVVDKINNVSYSFSNSSVTDAMGYPSRKVCDYMFDGEHSKSVYNSFKYDWEHGSRGNCFGMSLTSDLLYTSNGIYPSGFGSSKTAPKDLAYSNKNSSWGLSVGEWIQAMQISQVAQSCSKHYGCSISELVNAVKSDVNNGSATTVLFWWDGYGHAVVAYGIEKVSSTEDRILIYENNSPLKTQYITVTKNSSGTITNWSYSYKYGKTLQKNNTTLGYVTYNNSLGLWNKHGSTKSKGKLNNEVEYNLASVNSEDFTIYDVEDNVVAKVEEGVLETSLDGIELVHPVNYVEDGENEQTRSFLYLPIDVYNFENLDNNLEEFCVEMSNLELSTRVETTGNEVALCADDSSDFASAILNATEGDEYSITLGSSRDGEPEEMQWEGVGTGETISVMVEDGNLEMCNVESAQLTISDDVDGENISQVYVVSAIAEENGTITPEGEDPVWEGENQEYLIEADAGYKIKDVIVDGESIGAVDKYEFKDVHNNHEIIASFEKNNQLIDISGLTVSGLADATYTGKAITQKLVIKNGDYELIEGTDYSVEYSNNVNVGQASVTIFGIGNYTGTVVKTFNIHQIKSTTVEKTKTIVDLPTVKISKAVKAKKAFTVKWKKVSKKNQKKIGIVQIQYSKDKKFKSGVKTVTAKKNATSKKIKKLKSKKTYYVRVRAYKKVDGVVHVSKWSKVKKVKVK